MSTIDLVFEGGGAKGMVFIGALDVLFEGAGHTHGRLLGTSAGAITAVALAAGYTIPELEDALTEKDAGGKPIFMSFLGNPPPFDADAVRRSEIRRLLAELNFPFVPDFAEERLDDWIATQLAANDWGRHLFSFVERGGWFSADPFVAWATRKLNEGKFNGKPRHFGTLTLKEFHEQTQAELTLVAADTTWSRVLWLNHRTAPNCPVVWAARMSMSVPLLWQEVAWQAEWGSYYTWNPTMQKLEPNDLAGHLIVDGGLLSNFPIALFIADQPEVTAVVGPARTKNVLGLLIDETLPVPNRPPRQDETSGGPASTLTSLSAVQRLRRLMDTATGAHDNLAKAVFARNVVRLPAGGYGTTQFDMTDPERVALVSAGRQAMIEFLSSQSVLEAAAGAEPGFAVSNAARALANQAAAGLLGQ
jgi:predicted acylesterase/phospholipase RssA